MFILVIKYVLTIPFAGTGCPVTYPVFTQLQDKHSDLCVTRLALYNYATRVKHDYYLLKKQ